MNAMADAIIIPIFPLSLVVFPGEELRLHIFEPRYKQLVDDCKDTGMGFGIIPLVQKQLMTTGTFVKLHSIHKVYDDGRMDVLLKSLGSFQVIDVHRTYNNKLYSAATIKYLEPNFNSDKDLVQKVKELFSELCELNQVKPYKFINWSQFSSYDLGHYVGLSLAEEYALLEMPEEMQRLDYLSSQLQAMISQSRVRAHWLKQIHMNGEFRNFKAEEWQ